MYKAIIFDLDGTLLNTIVDIRDSMNRALSTLGLAEHDSQSYCYFVGNGVKILAQRAVGAAHQHLWERAAALYQADYGENSAVSTTPYKGVVELLESLSAKNMPVAVLSNKPHADTLKVIKHYFPDVRFSAVRGQIDSVPPKPDPAGAIAIAKELAVAPGDCLYVGDTLVDMTCANAAGMVPVGVTWGFRLRDELISGNAKFIIDAPLELLSLLT